ncbi:PH domain-containing protein [Arthrobacter sp. B3I4]|uniref:PH domain-containing protein n=1 Tax=Arthrobacter sp. B3I4 TaxID=3042267 RepID=UPI00278861F5|nr:PH domain-containing protein [Arthrobacter sp. B3I4]MDQ0757091.1 membrane protein YdbS with pleckstrin-like domain [Arthrobacter sp. B3I4]
MRKELFPGEQVIVVTRPQPRTLIVPALLFIVVAALTAYACAWIIKGGPAKVVPLVTPDWTPWMIGASLALAAWILVGYCLPKVVTWHASRYTLTSRRLVARYGMLRRRDQQVPLAAVRNVFIEQTLLQRSLRSGNISLDTGYPPGTVIPDVPEVMTFRNFILDAIDDLPEGELIEADDTMPNSNEWPWEMREGAGDER